MMIMIFWKFIIMIMIMILDQWSGSLSPKITDLFSDNANDRNRGKFELERDFCGKFSQNCIAR